MSVVSHLASSCLSLVRSLGLDQKMPTWVGDPHLPFEADCRPPYSFFFDLKPAVWVAGPYNSYPLDRLCTLARKQGAKAVITECALSRPDVVRELDDLDNHIGPGGMAKAVAVSFYSDEITSPFEIIDLSETSFIGTMVIIHFATSSEKISYVYEAIFKRPMRLGSSGEAILLLNNHTFSSANFLVEIRGRSFLINAVYYCQQNGFNHRCAQAALRASLRTLFPTAQDLSPVDINRLSGSTKPSDGLTDNEMKTVIDTYCQNSSGLVINCQNMKTDEYIANISCFVESGIICLVSFTTNVSGNYAQHVVTCFGYTQNTDEWHPKALLAYSGPKSAPFYPSSAWTDHLLIHDDNFGPYFTLDSRALETDKDVKPLVIFAILPSGFQNTPVGAQSLATSFLSTLLPMLPAGTNQWIDDLKQGSSPILRVTIVDQDDYSANLKFKGHDGSQMQDIEIDFICQLLPSTFYMVEVSLPPLYTGNHTKVGEVLVDPFSYDPNEPFKCVLGARLPGAFIYPVGGGIFNRTNSSLMSHSDLFRLGDHDQRW